MSQRGRRMDPAQKKARRQKQIAVGGAVLLVVLGAFEVPKVLKHGKAPATAATTTTTSTTPVAAGATPAGSAVAPTPVSAAVPAAQVALPDEAPASASNGQLVSFSLFKSKDPFKQQLVAEPAARSGAATPPPATTSTGSTPVESPPSQTSPAQTTPPVTPPVETEPVSTSPTETTPTETTPTETTPTETTSPPASTTTTQVQPPPPPPKAVSGKIEVNGVAEDVTIGDGFPKAQPLFRLVSIKDGVARVGIAGGTLQGSSQTVPLVQGKTLTLMNTADGMRYVLRLVSVAYTAGS
jgi:hypothetical protein